MSNEQSPAAEPSPEPYIAPKGPEFGGPGYADPYPTEEPSPVPPPPSQPQAQRQPSSPSLPPTPIGSPAPYRPQPPAQPAPVVPPAHQQPYQYGTQGYQQPPYVPQPYPYYQPVVPEHPSSVTVLVLGVVGLFFPLLSPVAWFIGSRAKKDVQRGAPYRWAATGQIGYVLGIIYSVIMLLGVGFFMLMILGLS